jgi:hypothetical protein
MVILWAYTPLVDLHANENLLVCFPSHLVLVGFGSVVIATRRLTPTLATLLRWYAVFAVVLLGVNLLLKVLPWHQENLRFLCAAILLWGIVFRVTEVARRRVQP